MSCLPNDLSLYTATIDSCVLTIEDPTAKVKYLFHLGDTTVIERDDSSVLIKDTDGSVINLSDSQMTDLGLTIASLLIAIKACQGGGGGGGGTTDGTAIVGTSMDGLTNFIVQVTYSESAGTYTYTLTDGTPVVEGVDFVVMSSAGSTAPLIETKCKCDDTLNDGGSVIVKYVEAYYITSDGTTTTSTLLGLYTDDTLNTTYTVVGTAADCDTLGTTPTVKQKMELVLNGTWSPTLLTQTYTVSVVGTGATFTDSDANVVSLIDGQTITFPTNDNLVMDTAPIVTSTGANVFVNYTELS